MENQYNIFISYKRKSLPTANNLYYRLTTRGYSTFFDLEEMGRDNFNIQLLKYIENAKDVFVILEEGSLSACQSDDWEKDWFCREIAYALEKKKNIIPILLNGYKMPAEDFFPDKLKELSFKQAPEFNFSFFEAYLDKLIEKDFLLSKPNKQDRGMSVFKFYSNADCQVFKEGKLVCSLEGLSDKPYYLPVSRKGDYRFKVVKDSSGESRIIDEKIDAVEEKRVEITWKPHLVTKERIHKSRTVLEIIGVIIVLITAIVSFVFWKNGNNESKELTTEPNAKTIDTIHSYYTTDVVDLGLPSGTLWRDRNLGADKTTDFGDWFAWGETVPSTKQPKASNDMLHNIIATVNDAAYVRLGKSFSLPSEFQFDELLHCCNWDTITQDGHFGYLVTSRTNGNSIFLPAGGCIKRSGHEYINEYGYYWTGEAPLKEKGMARELLFGVKTRSIESGRKNIPRSIRPVFNNNNKQQGGENTLTR